MLRHPPLRRSRAGRAVSGMSIIRMRHGWITTLRRDGSPRTSRVWFVEQGGMPPIPPSTDRAPIIRLDSTA